MDLDIRRDQTRPEQGWPDGRNTCSVFKLALSTEDQGFTGQALHLQGLPDGLGKPVLNLSRAQTSAHVIHRCFQPKTSGSAAGLIRHLKRFQRLTAIPFSRAPLLVGVMPHQGLGQQKLIDSRTPVHRDLGLIVLNEIKTPNGTRQFLREAFPCLLYTSPSPRDAHESRMPSSA